VPKRALFPLITHTCGCATLGIVFLWLAASHLALDQTVGSIESFHTTNTYLADSLKTAGASERLLHAFSTLPDKQPVAVVYRDDDGFDIFNYLAVMYLAWPKEVHAFPVGRVSLESQMRALAAVPVSASFFCGTTPPPGTGLMYPIGDGLVFVPRPEAAQP
jgi:hypothetical protein